MDTMENLNQRIAQLEEYNAQLLQQCAFKDERIAALEDWIEKLQTGKEFLENQSRNKDDRIAELEKWIPELEKSKLYLQEQWDAAVAAQAPIRAEVRQVEEKLLEYENQIGRQKYMLNLLMSDSWVQKVVKMRKIPVHL